MKDIANLIPHGKKNAVSRTTLIIKTGQTDRTNRDCIANSEEVVINLQDGSGYFRPLPSEKELVRRYYKQEHKRALMILKRLRKLKKWLEKADGQTELEVS